MSKEMRKYIDTFKQRLTESEKLNISDVMVSTFKIGDKFIDINSNNDEVFTVSKVDGNGVYDKHGWYRLSKNCKKVG
ncbi:MAG: hypothetical protein ACOYMA_22200 [Bacteroidia bacterium]